MYSIVDHIIVRRRNPFDGPLRYKVVPFVLYLNDYYCYYYYYNIRPPLVPLNNSVKIGSTMESSLGMKRKKQILLYT
jgi:hypothetical protein